jgi:WD40 repeat protein
MPTLSLVSDAFIRGWTRRRFFITAGSAGVVAAVGTETYLNLNPAVTGKPVHTFTSHTSWVETAAWSPDGTRLATASFDRTARIWSAATGQLIHTLTGHTDFVYEAV